MSLFVDLAYIGMFQHRLNQFSQKKSNLFNFRCPICGDSQKNKSKKRAFIYESKSNDGMIFICHNCGASMGLYGFIELMFPDLLGRYKMEKFRSSRGHEIEKAILMKPEEIPEEDSDQEICNDDLIPVDFLDRSHKARRYLQDERKLPDSIMDRFLFVEDFAEWYRQFDEETKLFPHSRIIIPYLNKDGEIYRYVCRVFDSKAVPRYLFIEISNDTPFYNFYGVNPNERVYIFEGQIDSMLIENSIAIGNAKFDRNLLTDFKDYVIVPDQQPRNPEVANAVKKAIDAGHPVSIWNRDLGKDINQMLINGNSIEKIKSIIDENVVSGPSARLKFINWRK